MSEHSEAFLQALIEGLPRHLESRLAVLGVEASSIADSITEVTADVEQRLRTLLALPFDRQAETPLEVVRAGLAPIGVRLSALGIDPHRRDDEQERVAPDDPYGLAPASAAELGEEALEASLAWGLTKTAALTRPLLLVVTSNLMDASRFEPAARSAGYRIEVRHDTEASTTPLVAFVDLEHDGSDEAIRVLAAERVRVVAYGPHVDDQAMVRAVALGAAAAEPRSRMFRNPSEHLPPLV